MTATPSPATHDPPDAPALTAAVDDDAPGLSWEEYVERRREIEARLEALAARLVASRRFPRWMYHATHAPRVVATRAERQALGTGWQPTPV